MEQIESLDVDRGVRDHPCCVESCGERALAKIDMRAFCMNHFVSVSFHELQSSYGRLKGETYDSTAMASYREISSIWAREAEKLVEEAQFADQATKARLIEAILWVGQAGKSLRRSARTATAVPVWLRREDPRRTWEEDTWTTTVSRHGASFVCRHPVEAGGTVILTRKDKGGRAQARVVYSRMNAEGRRQIGVELIDRDDFWD
ncbi:MAG: hypothetical protein ABSE45_07685 [Candidatus Acidiferrales bacterium]|jgi:nucleotidyltransferase/DNA polymerase involved in DNA repair